MHLASTTVIDSSRTPPMRRTQGFTLIEVLITIFVFSIGLLGVASLQAVAKKSNYDATQRTISSTLSTDMIARIRANASNNQTGNYLTDDVSESVDVAPPVDCQTGTGCSPSELTAYDLWSWNQALEGATTTSDGINAGGLADPTGCIAVVAAAPTPSCPSAGVYSVAIAWRGVAPMLEPDINTPAGDPTLNNCGNNKQIDGANIYDDPDFAGSDNRMRRIVVTNTYFGC